MHYMRKWRNGTTDKIMTRALKINHSAGYVVIYDEDHPLATKNGYVYEHRKVYYDAQGAGPFSCHWCDEVVGWDVLDIDHVDDDKSNNNLSNLVASCHACNTARGFEKCKDTWRNKCGVTYKGKVYTMNELAKVAGISRPSLVLRMKRMSIEKAVEMPRGKTGPKQTGASLR